MRRWTGLYDELASARYPALVAYAGLLTADTQTADALVASALRHTFAKPRRLVELGQAEQEVRQAIVTQFLAQESSANAARLDRGDAKPSASTAVADDTADPAGDAPAAGVPPAHEHGVGDDPPANPYAPPGFADESSSPAPDPLQARPSHEPAHASATRASVLGASGPRSTTAPAEDDDHMSRDEERLRAAMRALTARSRAVAVLRYHDGLTPGQISERLGLPMETVLPVLHEVRDVVRVRLGIVLADDAFDIEPAGAAEITVAAHARRAAR